MDKFDADIKNVQYAIERAPLVWADQVNVRNSLEILAKAIELAKIDRAAVLAAIKAPALAHKPEEDKHG